MSRLKADTAHRPWRTGRVVCMPLLEEAHRVGLVMLEHVLLAQGWRVTTVDLMPTPELVAFLRDAGDAVAVALSVRDGRVGVNGATTDLSEATALVDRITNPLTTRETEVLDGVSIGLTNAETGAQLGVRPTTIKTHLDRIFAKTDTRDRAAAVTVACRRGRLNYSQGQFARRGRVSPSAMSLDAVRRTGMTACHRIPPCSALGADCATERTTAERPEVPPAVNRGVSGMESARCPERPVRASRQRDVHAIATGGTAVRDDLPVIQLF